MPPPPPPARGRPGPGQIYCHSHSCFQPRCGLPLSGVVYKSIKPRSPVSAAGPTSGDLLSHPAVRVPRGRLGASFLSLMALLAHQPHRPPPPGHKDLLPPEGRVQSSGSPGPQPKLSARPALWLLLPFPQCRAKTGFLSAREIKARALGSPQPPEGALATGSHCSLGCV